MVSLASSSANGQTIFGKNSDRPANECQPLIMQSRRNYPPDTEVETQFLVLPQSPVTYKHVGSRPYWCWGYEHGFNEHQVVIGNESLPSRLGTSGKPKLIGMELVRLGLERAKTASTAVEVITDLITRYGQGKFENADGVRTYDNIFLIGDPRSAFVIEAVGHDWAVKRLSHNHSISNVGMLGADADRVSLSARDAAATFGLFNGGGEEDFNFASVFADTAASASGIARRNRSTALLKASAGRLDAGKMMGILKDHSSGDNPTEAAVVDVAGPVSLCVHRQDASLPATTAASLVADLDGEGRRLPVYWCCLYSPCLGVYLPMFIEGELPPKLAIGTGEASGDSPWWTFHHLTREALKMRPEERSEIRKAIQVLQVDLLDTAYHQARTALRLIRGGREKQAARQLSSYMEKSVDRALTMAAQFLSGQIV